MLSNAPNAVIAIVLALLPLPALRLLDHLNRGCGDGLCGVLSGLLILGGLAGGTLIFVLRSSRRDEPHAFLRWIPLLIWPLVFIPLVL